MKFMKLGSKPDAFQTKESNIRYVASELATDLVIRVWGIKFCLHKFPLLSKSALLRKLVSSSTEDEIILRDIPGGPAAFETCAKFCYGMTVTLNAHNVVSVRRAAEFLDMQETVEKGNLLHKVDIFLASTIFHTWKDSLIVAKSLSHYPDELKLIRHCVDSIAAKASTDISKVDWSYTYNRKKADEEKRKVPFDWWADDVSELDVDSYKRVITSVKKRGLVPSEAVGEALKVYAYRNLPDSGKNWVPHEDFPRFCLILESVVWLLPAEKGCVECSFLLKMLKAAVSADSDEKVKSELVKRIGQQLEEASVNDLLIQSGEGGESMYDVEIVRKILEEFKDRNLPDDSGILSEASEAMVAKLVDDYLVEIAKDPNLPLSSFVGIAEMVSGFSRTDHDGLYRAIDTYLKARPEICKRERMRICGAMDCKKLSVEACAHAAQNERLPLRVVVRILFFLQVRRAAASSSGSSTPDLPKAAVKHLNSQGSSRSATTNTDEDWGDAEELRRGLRGELAALRLSSNGKAKGSVMPGRIFWRSGSRRSGGHGENSGSDESGSLGSGHDNGAFR